MPQITPFLWFDHQADDAMAFYTSTFPDSRIQHVERYPDESLDPHFVGMSGKVISGSFELCGRPFLCLDGGPQFTINPAVSFLCSFPDPADLASVWNRLSEGGMVLMELGAYPWSASYGWLQDQFGVSWQLTLSGEGQAAPTITPFLMFTGPAAGRAEEALGRYTALFDGSAIDSLDRYVEGDVDQPGLVKQARFHLDTNEFVAMDSTAGHQFTFNEAVSLMVSCRDQDEIDRYWNALTGDGGEESQCGWCKDAYGVSWQIIPANLAELLGAGPAAVQAMMGMRKLDIGELERAGGSSH